MQVAIGAAGVAGAWVCRGVLERIGARRLAARGHDALDDVSVQLELADDGGRKSIPPACSSAKRPAGRLPGAVALAAAVAGCQRASSTGLSPSSGIVGARAAGGERRALAFSGPAAFGDLRERDDVGETRHSRCGRRPSRFGINPGRKRRSRQSARPVVARLLAADSERVCRLGYRRARLTIRRRARVGNDLSSTGAPHGPVATGRLFGSTATSPRSRLARSAIPLNSVAASTRWTPAQARVASVACRSPGVGAVRLSGDAGANV